MGSYLDITFYSNDLGKIVSLRDYFKALLRKLWTEGEEFSGKRPFGDSGWQYDVATSLDKAGISTALFNDDEEIDWTEFERVINIAIEDL